MITVRSKYLNKFIRYSFHHGQNKSPTCYPGDPVHLSPDPCCFELSLLSLKKMTASSKFLRANLQLLFLENTCFLGMHSLCPHVWHIGGHHNTPKLESVSLRCMPWGDAAGHAGQQWHCNLVSIDRCTPRPKKTCVIVTESQNIT